MLQMTRVLPEYFQKFFLTHTSLDNIHKYQPSNFYFFFMFMSSVYKTFLVGWPALLEFFFSLLDLLKKI